MENKIPSENRSSYNISSLLAHVYVFFPYVFVCFMNWGGGGWVPVKKPWKEIMMYGKQCLHQRVCGLTDRKIEASIVCNHASPSVSSWKHSIPRIGHKMEVPCKGETHPLHVKEPITFYRRVKTWCGAPALNTINRAPWKSSTLPVFGRHQFFGTSERYGKPHEIYYRDEWIIITLHVAGFPASSNILIFPSQFWQIWFESCWLHCSKCRILVLF